MSVTTHRDRYRGVHVSSVLEIMTANTWFFSRMLNILVDRILVRRRRSYILPSPMYWKDATGALFAALEEMHAMHQAAARRGRVFDIPRFDVRGIAPLFGVIVPNVVSRLCDLEFRVADAPSERVPRWIREMTIERLHRKFVAWRASDDESVRGARARGRRSIRAILSDDRKVSETREKASRTVSAMFSKFDILSADRSLRATCDDRVAKLLVVDAKGARGVAGDPLDGVKRAMFAATGCVFVDTDVLD